MNLSPVELAIVIPTFCERDNVGPLVELVRKALPTVSWEIIFVDDNSRDGTAQAAWEISRSDPRVRCIKRIGRRGLSSACIEGMLATGAPYIAVMEADQG
jgi:dolichol-phosphate mannosyltransferase